MSDEKRQEHVVENGRYYCGETQNIDAGESRCEICGRPLTLTGFDAWWERRKDYHP